MRSLLVPPPPLHMPGIAGVPEPEPTTEIGRPLYSRAGKSIK